MRVETVICHYDELQSKVLPYLRGQVFHVTHDRGFTGIVESGFVKAGGELRSNTKTGAVVQFGPSRGYPCLVDLRDASDAVIETTLRDYYYFLDPFSDSAENVFLLLESAEYELLIANEVGLNYSGAAAVPEVEVWYPKTLPLSKIRTAIRVPIRRADPFSAIDTTVLLEIAAKGAATIKGGRRINGPKKKPA